MPKLLSHALEIQRLYIGCFLFASTYIFLIQPLQRQQLLLTLAADDDDATRPLPPRGASTP